MTDWKTRIATSADVAHIARHRYFKGESETDIEAYAAWVAKRLKLSTYVGFVAEADRAIVAGAGAVLLDWGPTRGDPSSTRARVVNVFTEPAYRGRGIGKLLVERVLAHCTEQGVRVFCLAASSDAAAMYKALGFVPYEQEMVLRRLQAI